MLTLGLMLSSQDPPKKKKEEPKKQNHIVIDTTSVDVAQRDTVLIEQRRLNIELKELVEQKKKEKL